MRVPHSLPTVSALMGAYNYERYVGAAIESALAQDYPAELLEVVVIDDGSTDGTAEIVRRLADEHPGRIRLISQVNGGYIAATNRAIAEARGDLLALLDADDIWLPDKIRRQVELLESRPELGLVFGDMIVVDGNEQIVRPSQIGQIGPLPERAFTRLLVGNVATQSSIMVRSALREHFHPIPNGVPYADWWLTLTAARVAQVDYIREPVALYREHGANLTGGVVGGASGVREHRKEVAFQLYALRHLPLDSLAPDELTLVWNSVEEHARMVIGAAGSHFVQVADVGPDDAARADAALAEAEQLEDEGDLRGAMVSSLRALAWDPFRLGARERFSAAVAAANAAASRPDPLTGARDFVVLAAAEDLLADDTLLTRYAQAMSGAQQVTLAIDASALAPDEAARALQELVLRCGLSDRSDIDMIALVGPQTAIDRHRTRRRTRARYGRTEAVAAGIPVFSPGSLAELRAYADGAADDGSSVLASSSSA